MRPGDPEAGWRPGVGTAEGLPEHLDGLDGVGQSFQGRALRSGGIRDGCVDRPWPAPRRRPGSARSRRWHRAEPPRRPGRRSSRRPLGSTSPPLSPTRRPTECSRPRLSRSTPCCMATAARQGGRGRGEHHHEPVTEVLHLGATGFGDRLAQDREVIPADLVGRLGRQALRQLRRAHHVGEQDRHVLGRHGNARSSRTAPP